LFRGFTLWSNRIKFRWEKLMRNKESIPVTKMTFMVLLWTKVLVNVRYEGSLNRLPDFLIQPLL